MSELVYEITRLKGTNKEGVIRPDNNGYYTMCIGGINAFNSAGEFYTYEGACEFFKAQHSLQKRIARGLLRAEYGHPQVEEVLKDLGIRASGLNALSFKAEIARLYQTRALRIEPRKVCGTWVRVKLSQEPLIDEAGRKIVPIMGTIRPSGPYGKILIEQFETQGENVCFSIRCLANKFFSSGRMNKRITHIVTWDYVTEPGIYNAEKLISPTLESVDESYLDNDSLKEIVKALSSISTESQDYQEVLQVLSNYRPMPDEYKDVLTDMKNRVRPKSLTW